VPLAYGLFAANYAVGESLVTGTPGSERPVWPALTARFVRVGSVPLVPSRGPAPFGGTPIAQINLQPSGPPTAGAPGGVAEILATKQGQGLPGKSGAVLGITITATTVPRLSGREAYAVWLTGNRSGRGRSTPALLGFVNPGPDRAGRLHTAGTLPRDVGRFSTILITIEHAARPRSPTRVVLQAALIGIRFPSP